MEKDISKIKESVTKEVAKTKTILDLNNIKTSYLGKKGSVTKLYEKLKEASAKEKKSLGKDINDVKTFINEKALGIWIINNLKKFLINNILIFHCSDNNN